jgi:hypothetical protein
MVTWLVLVLFACNGDPKTTNPVFFDEDGDGFTSDEDCNDNDPSIYPTADEVCDEKDNDCDEEIDEDPIDSSSWYADADEDGFGDPESMTESCTIPEGYTENADDCDDSDADVYPGSFPEEGDNCVLDADGDGYGAIDASSPYDAGSDCDDENADINPVAVEICDLLDNDCDSLIDDEDTEIDTTHPDTELWYADEDGDFYGDENNTFYTCGVSTTGSSFAGDCDDTDPLVNPDMEEVCDVDVPIDNNCNGLIDEEEDPLLECDVCTEFIVTEYIGEVYSETILAGDDYEPTCSQGTNDTIVRWTAPASGEYTFSSTADYIALWEGCGDNELACDSGAVTNTFSYGDNVNVLLEGNSGNLSVFASQEYVCDDGIDDDADGYMDCDDDEDCWFDANCGGAQCPNFELIDPVTYTVVDGNSVLQSTVATSGDDEQASCFASGGQDNSYRYTANETGCLQVVAYSDSIDVSLTAMDSCGGSELDCNASDSYFANYFGTTYAAYIPVDVTAGNNYIIVVDAVSSLPTDSFELAILLNNVQDCNGQPVQ